MAEVRNKVLIEYLMNEMLGEQHFRRIN